MHAERPNPPARRRIASLAALYLLATGMAACVLSDPDGVKPDGAAPTNGAPTAAAPEPVEASPTPVPPAVTWRTGLTPEQEARWLALLEDEDTDIVLVRIEGEQNPLTLDQLLGRDTPPRQYLNVRVLDGSEPLYLQRKQLTSLVYEPKDGDRDVAVGETFYAAVANIDPVAKLIDGPPRALGLTFAGSALEEPVVLRTVNEVEASPEPAAQDPFRRMFRSFRDRLRSK